MHAFIVQLREPINLHGSLEVFRRPGTDLIDSWDGARLMRTAPTPAGFVPYMCLVPESGPHDQIDVLVRNPSDETLIQVAVRELFMAAPPEFGSLIASDAVVGSLNAKFPGIRPVLQPDLFTALVRSISAQQINLRWAATIRERLAQKYGDRHEIDGLAVYSLNAHRLSEADPADIRALQFTMRKAESVVSVATAFADGSLSLEDLIDLPDDDVIDRLVALRGIGLWSAEWILCRTLGRPRVVAGDLGVRKAVGAIYANGSLPSESDVRRLTAHWGPSAGIAQALALYNLAFAS